MTTFNIKHLEVAQNSRDWEVLRLGKPTASQFHNIITPEGKRTTGEKRKVYMMKLICERLLGDKMGDDISEVRWVKWGREHEAEAAHILSETLGLSFRDGGFITNGRAGCSPDRIVVSGGNQIGHGAVEIKCPSPWTHMANLLYGPGENYRPQVQGQMYVGGFEYVHFFSYHPNMPFAHRVTVVDGLFQKRLRAELDLFCDELDAETERARGFGSYLRLPTE